MKSTYLHLGALSMGLLAIGGLQAQDTPQEWLDYGQQELQKRLERTPDTRPAKNVIFMVGDGMGISTNTAARIYQGQLEGNPGEENELYFETFPWMALSKVYNVDSQVPDSAGTMTAMITGVKTNIGVLGVDEDIVRGDVTTVAGNELATLIEMAEDAGLSTGIISTARITHATPAACYAKSPDRNWEDVSDMPDDAVAAEFKDIALQLVEFEHGDGVDVILGGGRRHFLPREGTPLEDDSRLGDRTDSRDLTAEWQEANPEGVYVWNQAQFDAIDTSRVSKVLGLFESSHMEYEADREGDVGGEPSIAEMTEFAIKILSRNPKGYVLVVESGRIDHAHHDTNAARALIDTVAFDDAIEVADENTSDDDTLIVVTADHSHVFTIAGYPTRGNPILGKVITNDSAGEPENVYAGDLNSMPYTALAYQNGGSFQFVEGVRPDLTEVDTTDIDFHQEVAVPLAPGAETHSGEDVAIYAKGPHAYLFQGVQEQNYIFHVMAEALAENLTMPGTYSQLAPWIYTPYFGWAYLFDGDLSGAFLYSNEVSGWLYGSSEITPWFYQYGVNDWRYFAEIDGDYVVYYSVAAGDWIIE